MYFNGSNSADLDQIQIDAHIGNSFESEQLLDYTKSNNNQKGVTDMGSLLGKTNEALLLTGVYNSGFTTNIENQKLENNDQIVDFGGVSRHSQSSDNSGREIRSLYDFNGQIVGSGFEVEDIEENDFGVFDILDETTVFSNKGSGFKADSEIGELVGVGQNSGLWEGLVDFDSNMPNYTQSLGELGTRDEITLSGMGLSDSILVDSLDGTIFEDASGFSATGNNNQLYQKINTQKIAGLMDFMSPKY